MKKKYISTGANPLSIDVMDNGKMRTFDFSGGVNNPEFKPPTIVTKDETEQKLIEGHPTFGVSFILDPMVPLVPIEPEVKTSEELTGDQDEEPGTTEDSNPETNEEEDTTNSDDEQNEDDVNPSTEETTSTDEDNQENDSEDTSSEDTESDQPTVPSSFKNVQEAKNWMVNNLNVSANSVRNKDLMVAKAEELGIKIVLETDNN